MACCLIVQFFIDVLRVLIARRLEPRSSVLLPAKEGTLSQNRVHNFARFDTVGYLAIPALIK